MAEKTSTHGFGKEEWKKIPLKWRIRIRFYMILMIVFIADDKRFNKYVDKLEHAINLGTHAIEP